MRRSRVVPRHSKSAARLKVRVEQAWRIFGVMVVLAAFAAAVGGNGSASAQTVTTTTAPPPATPTVCANQSGFVGAFDPSNLCTVGGEGLQVVTLPGNWDVVARSGTVVPCLKRLVPGQGGAWDGWVGGGPQCQYRPLLSTDMWLFTAVGQPAGKLLVYCAFSDQGANNGRVDPALQLIGAGNNCRSDPYGLGALYGDPYVVDRFRVIAGVTTEAWEATAFAGGGYVPALDPAPGIWKTGWRIVADPFAGPVDDCQWVSAGGGSYSDSVVSLPSSSSRVTLVGTRCGVSGLALNVVAAGSAGSLVTWLGADNQQYSLTVINGNVFYAHNDHGIDLGPFVVGLNIAWETNTGRVRSKAPGGAWSAWSPAVESARLVRDASSPPRLVLFGHPSSASAGTVLNLGGSSLSTSIDPASDPTGGAGGSTAHNGCEKVDGLGLDPSSWVPGLVGGVSCVVGSAVDLMKEGLVSLFTYPEMQADATALRALCESQVPCSWSLSVGTWVSAQTQTFAQNPFGPLPNKCVRVGAVDACTDVLDGASPAASTIAVIVGAMRMYLVIKVVELAWSYIVRSSTVSSPEQLMLF